MSESDIDVRPGMNRIYGGQNRPRCYSGVIGRCRANSSNQVKSFAQGCLILVGGEHSYYTPTSNNSQ